MLFLGCHCASLLKLVLLLINSFFAFNYIVFFSLFCIPYFYIVMREKLLIPRENLGLASFLEGPSSTWLVCSRSILNEVMLSEGYSPTLPLYRIRFHVIVFRMRLLLWVSFSVQLSV